MKLRKLFLSMAITIFSFSFCPISFADQSLKKPSTTLINQKNDEKEKDADKNHLNCLIAHYAKLNKIPITIAHAIIYSESNYKSDAHGRSGEIGLMQLMPLTARTLGFKGPLTDLYCPDVNLKFGMQYLAKARKMAKGDLCRTILKYNAGYHAKRMNPVSTRYCKKVKHFIASKKKSYYQFS